MTRYVHIDAPDRPGPLPRAWRNVSGLHLLDAPALAALGWLPWVDDPRPAHDPLHERLVASVEITDAGARRVWAVERRPEAEIPAVEAVAAEAVVRIKAGAGAAIEGRFPLWRQSNLMARAIELLDIRRDRLLTEAEAVERDAIEAAREWIKRQRAESDRLEAAAAALLAGEGDDDAKRRALAALGFAAVA
ncbi:MAG: hypothetical protein ACE37J_13780 [Pikeienuella sp.]|uniref:hypothetical protein n=1 Tax=Pikeienuella sp. TaxID=2831957 RepID=UPI00391A3D06